MTIAPDSDSDQPKPVTATRVRAIPISPVSHMHGSKTSRGQASETLASRPMRHAGRCCGDDDCDSSSMTDVVAPETLEIRLLSRFAEDRGVARFFGWLLSTVLVLISVVFSALTSGPLADLIPMHEIEVRRRRSDEELLRGEVPVLRGRRLLKLMQADASAMSETDFVQKWADAHRWALLLDAPN